MSDLGDVLRQVVCTPKHIPGDWQFYKLTDICNPKQWKTISATEMTESGYPVFGANGFVGFYHEYNHEHEAVAITCRGNTCGTINRIPPRTYITGNSMALDDIKKNVITQDYLYYALKYRGVGDSISGSAQPQITGAGLRSIEFPAPPLPEQQKIAIILSSVDDVIEKTRAQIDKLKDLKTGMMQELLTNGIGHTEFKDSPVGRIPEVWNVVELGNVAKLERGRFSHRPRNDPQFYGGNIPFLQTGDIPKEAPQITCFSQTLNEKGLKISKLFLKGTLVITIAATIGEIGILEFDSCFPDSLVGIKVNQQKAKPMFILYLMRHLKSELESLAPQTAQKNINLDILQPFQIPLPSAEEQELIANAIGSVDVRVNVLLEKLERTKSTKKALMQDLLTGKVRVNLNESAAIENG
ncbi:MAG TPA: restriction endonuclease subunit S [Nitrosomonas mobilis]|nr:restriction endonuclease subunit S [Nitrosomonas mobilis]